LTFSNNSELYKVYILIERGLFKNEKHINIGGNYHSLAIGLVLSGASALPLPNEGGSVGTQSQGPNGPDVNSAGTQEQGPGTSSASGVGTPSVDGDAGSAGYGGEEACCMPNVPSQGYPNMGGGYGGMPDMGSGYGGGYPDMGSGYGGMPGCPSGCPGPEVVLE